MSADDFKQNAILKSTKTTPVVKSTAERGRPVTGSMVPSLPGIKTSSSNHPVVSMEKKAAPKTASIGLILDNFKKAETLTPIVNAKKVLTN